MGTWLSPNKGGYYWYLLSYLADKRTALRDSRLIPHTPSMPQTYVAFYPLLYSPGGGANLSFYLNGNPIASAVVSNSMGLVYFDYIPPLGQHTLTTVDQNGNLLASEIFIAKEYAMWLGVAAQSYEDRLAGIYASQADQYFLECRSSRLYDIVGVFFDFPPPPGWSSSRYRQVLLGNPGLLEAFMSGGSRKAVKDVIAAITGQSPVISEFLNGVYPGIYDVAGQAPSVWGVPGNSLLTPPGYSYFYSHDEEMRENAVDIHVRGSSATVSGEQVLKKTNSFIQSGTTVFSLDGLTLVFSISTTDNPGQGATYRTTFPGGTNSAALAATAILAQNPSLTNVIYPTPGGYLRIGVTPVSGVTNIVSILSGTALPVLGWVPGQAIESENDCLANPWVEGGFSLVSGLNSYASGTDFTFVEATGEIVWNPLTPANSHVPMAGTILSASYTYQMRREVMRMTALASSINDIPNYAWS